MNGVAAQHPFGIGRVGLGGAEIGHGRCMRSVGVGYSLAQVNQNAADGIYQHAVVLAGDLQAGVVEDEEVVQAGEAAAAGDAVEEGVDGEGGVFGHYYAVLDGAEGGRRISWRSARVGIYANRHPRTGLGGLPCAAHHPGR